MRFIELADTYGNGIAKFARMAEMYQKRMRMRKSDYMHHFDEYGQAHTLYVSQYRRMHDSRPKVESPLGEVVENGCHINRPTTTSHGYVRISADPIVISLVRSPLRSLVIPPIIVHRSICINDVIGSDSLIVCQTCSISVEFSPVFISTEYLLPTDHREIT